MLTLQQLTDGTFRLTLDLTVGNNHILKVWYFAEVEPGIYPLQNRTHTGKDSALG